MSLSANAENALTTMAGTIPHPAHHAPQDYRTHHSPQDYRKPIRVFIEFYKAGDTESLHPDVIREWAGQHGWSESDARDLGEMAETVRATMSELGY